MQLGEVLALGVGGVDQGQCGIHQRVGLRADQHRGVADRLDEADGAAGHLGGQGCQPAGHRADLLHRRDLAQAGEPGQVGEADRHVASIRQQLPGAQLGAADDVVANLLDQVLVEDVLEHGAQQRGDLARHRGVAQPEVALGVARSQQALGHEVPDRRGHPRRRLADHPADLERPLLGKPGLGEGPGPLGGLEVVLAEHLGIEVLGDGEPQRLALAAHHQLVLARRLGDVACRVTALARQRQLDREQRQPVLGGGALELVQRHAGLVELAQQVEPSLALVSAQALEQTPAGEVGFVGGHPQ